MARSGTTAERTECIVGEFSVWHWAIALGVAVLLFGSAKLPDLARGLGQSMRILRAETRALHTDGDPIGEHDTAGDRPAAQTSDAAADRSSPSAPTM